jgi:hypothetical protein
MIRQFHPFFDGTTTVAGSFNLAFSGIENYEAIAIIVRGITAAVVVYTVFGSNGLGAPGTDDLFALPGISAPPAAGAGIQDVIGLGGSIPRQPHWGLHITVTAGAGGTARLVVIGYHTLPRGGAIVG